MKVAECYASMQGEGRYAGTPAVFLRLSGCNLLCKGEWECDTIPVWQKGKEQTAESLYAEWAENGWIKKIQGGSHVILTGGEPLLQQDDEELLDFLALIKEQDAFIEIETNGTMLPREISRFIDFYNCSPKLSNSGMPQNRRVVPEAVAFVRERPHCFKFVVKDDDDVEEALHTFAALIEEDKENIYLLPASCDQESLLASAQKIEQAAAKYGLKISPRLHILHWNRATGV